ncbi:MAG: hypothetical protein RLZZ440_664 [Planctomycetota bacterium]|jgi:ATP adenylyltransferase
MAAMDNDRLWAPWRLGYVQGTDPEATARAVTVEAWRPGADEDCFLCRAAAVSAEHDRTLGIVDRTDLSVVVINRFPYSNGHLLVAPLDHRATLTGLDDGQLLDLQRCLARWCRVMEAAMHAQGFNVGLNLGRVAGAGVPGHLHWHIVPRWAGDVNFMATLAGTRVLPQALDELWLQLTAAARATPP